MEHPKLDNLQLEESKEEYFILSSDTYIIKCQKFLKQTDAEKQLKQYDRYYQNYQNIFVEVASYEQICLEKYAYIIAIEKYQNCYNDGQTLYMLFSYQQKPLNLVIQYQNQYYLAELIQQLIQKVSQLHQYNLYHGDLNLKNIFVSSVDKNTFVTNLSNPLFLRNDNLSFEKGMDKDLTDLYKIVEYIFQFISIDLIKIQTIDLIKRKILQYQIEVSKLKQSEDRYSLAEYKNFQNILDQMHILYQIQQINPNQNHEMLWINSNYKCSLELTKEKYIDIKLNEDFLQKIKIEEVTIISKYQQLYTLEQISFSFENIISLQLYYYSAEDQEQFNFTQLIKLKNLQNFSLFMYNVNLDYKYLIQLKEFLTIKQDLQQLNLYIDPSNFYCRKSLLNSKSSDLSKSLDFLQEDKINNCLNLNFKLENQIIKNKILIDKLKQALNHYQLIKNVNILLEYAQRYQFLEFSIDQSKNNLEIEINDLRFNNFGKLKIVFKEKNQIKQFKFSSLNKQKLKCKSDETKNIKYLIERWWESEYQSLIMREILDKQYRLGSCHIDLNNYMISLYQSQLDLQHLHINLRYCQHSFQEFQESNFLGFTEQNCQKLKILSIYCLFDNFNNSTQMKNELKMISLLIKSLKLLKQLSIVNYQFYITNFRLNRIDQSQIQKIKQQFYQLKKLVTFNVTQQ